MYNKTSRLFICVVIIGILFLVSVVLGNIDGKLAIGTNAGAISNFEQFNATTTGSFTQWQYTNPLLNEVYHTQAVAAQGYVYDIGGEQIDFIGSSLIQRAKIQNDGSLSAWDTIAYMPTERFAHAVVVNNNYLYIIDGEAIEYSGNFNTVIRAKFNSDGTLGNWISEPSTNYARHGSAAVVVNGYIYLMGGADSGGARLNSVERAKINDDGSLGSWTLTSPMINSRWHVKAVADKGYIYAIGGANNSDIYVSTATIERVIVNADGSLGTWEYTNHSIANPAAPAAVVNDHKLYISGGAPPDSSGSSRDVISAQVNDDGSLGAWETVYSMNTSRHGHGMTCYGNYLYVTGGLSYLTGSYWLPINSVEYLPLSNNTFNTTGKLAIGTNSGIYTLDPDGSNVTKVTDKLVLGVMAWTPDAKSLLVINNRNGPIWRLNVYTGETTLVNSEQTWVWGDLSRDGSKIVAVDAAQQYMYVMDADGSNMYCIATANGYYLQLPRWSPDGTKIVFTHAVVPNAELWIMDADGNNPRQLTYTSSSVASPTRGIWLPNGRTIVFYNVTTPGGSTASQLWAIDTDGTNLRQITSLPGFNAWEGVSPDGERIAFPHGNTGYSDATAYWVVNIDGSNPHKIWDIPANESGTSFVEWSQSSSKQPSSISCVANQITMYLGSEIYLGVTISPSVVGAPLRVEFHRPDNTIFSEQSFSNSSSFYLFHHIADTIGLWSVKAIWDGNDIYDGATSATVMFMVNAPVWQPSTINCYANPTAAAIGKHVTLYGVIDPPPFIGTVYLNYIKPDNSTGSYSAGINEGNGNVTIVPNMIGTWAIQAYWAGDTIYTGSTSSWVYFSVYSGYHYWCPLFGYDNTAITFRNSSNSDINIWAGIHDTTGFYLNETTLVVPARREQTTLNRFGNLYQYVHNGSIEVVADKELRVAVERWNQNYLASDEFIVRPVEEQALKTYWFVIPKANEPWVGITNPNKTDVAAQIRVYSSDLVLRDSKSIVIPSRGLQVIDFSQIGSTRTIFPVVIKIVADEPLVVRYPKQKDY
jgi:Tol biopolymer transport system component